MFTEFSLLLLFRLLLSQVITETILFTESGFLVSQVNLFISCCCRRQSSSPSDIILSCLNHCGWPVAAAAALGRDWLRFHSRCQLSDGPTRNSSFRRTVSMMKVSHNDRILGTFLTWVSWPMTDTESVKTDSNCLDYSVPNNGLTDLSVTWSQVPVFGGDISGECNCQAARMRETIATELCSVGMPRAKHDSWHCSEPRPGWLIWLDTSVSERNGPTLCRNSQWVRS